MYRYPTHQKFAFGFVGFWTSLMVVFSVLFFPHFPIAVIASGLMAYVIFLDIDEIEGKYPNILTWKEEKTRFKKCLFWGPLALIVSLWIYEIVKKENKNTNENNIDY